MICVSDISLWTIEDVAPARDMTVSEWADQNRVLSRVASAEPGQWHTSSAEYQRGIMDAVTDPLYETVIVMSSAQVGKTEIILNALGYHIDQDPAPTLVVQPTLEMAMAFSKDRLSHMLKESPVLSEKVQTPRSRDSENSILHKKFPGGHVTLTGANSPATLSSRPVRLCLFDEVDRFPVSAGTEGDPVNLGKKRTTTFWNRKIVLTSTPTIKGESRIETAYDESDQRRFHVPCPHCGSKQVLKWGGPDEAFGIKWGRVDGVINAQYLCEFCAVLLDEIDKADMVKHGEWIAGNPGGKVAGFHLNELYSPWVEWSQVVEDFLLAKKSPETLKVWINTALGETYEEIGEKIEPHKLQERCEDYTADEIPEGVIVITAGVDVQEDRLEMEFCGWGVGEESWSIDYVVIHGDPSQQMLWDQLDDEISRRFKHPLYNPLTVSMTFVDSGYLTDVVYRYCRVRRSVYAVQGQGNTPQKARPVVVEKTKRTKKGEYVPVGVDTAKDVIYARLRFSKPGPGYSHFPESYPPDYFTQLTAEEKRTKYINNRPVKYWHLTKGKRNEALDCRVYAFAALRFLGRGKPFKFKRHRARLAKRSEVDLAPVKGSGKKEKVRERPIKKPVVKSKPRKRKGGFVHGF